jgi:hypothetical protein
MPSSSRDPDTGWTLLGSFTMSTHAQGSGDAFLDRLKRWCSSPRACAEPAGIEAEAAGAAGAEDHAKAAVSNRGPEGAHAQEGKGDSVKADASVDALSPSSSSLASSGSTVSVRSTKQRELTPPMRNGNRSTVLDDEDDEKRQEEGRHLSGAAESARNSITRRMSRHIVKSKGRTKPVADLPLSPSGQRPAGPKSQHRRVRNSERLAASSSHKSNGHCGRATATTAPISNGAARSSPRHRGGTNVDDDYEYDEEHVAQKPTKRASQRDYLSVYVKDPSRRSLVDVLVATLGPVEDASSIGIKYRDTISDLWRRGQLYVMDDGIEKRIPFVEEREHAGGGVLYRKWPNKPSCFLWLSGVDDKSSRPPIVFFVYTDRATRRNVTSVKWNGRLSSAEAEAAFARSGQSAASVAKSTPSRPLRRAPAAATHALSAAPVAAAKRSIRIPPVEEIPPKRRRVAPSARVATNADRKEPPTATADTTRKNVTATNSKNAAAVAPTPNLRVPTHPEEHVLMCDDGSSLVDVFRERVKSFQQKFGNLCSVDLGFVYEDIMEMLLKEGYVHVAAASTT